MNFPTATILIFVMIFIGRLSSQSFDASKSNLKSEVKSYIPKINTSVKASEQPCSLITIKDEQTNQIVSKQTSPSLFFKHTDEAIVSQFIDRDLIHCNGFIISKGAGVKFLDIEISIASSNANKIFGNLAAGDFIVIKLINGVTISLKNKQTSNGQWVPALQSTLYAARMPVGIREENLLREFEVDSIIIRWSKVQEEYPVYEMDFFIDHFNCLENG